MSEPATPAAPETPATPPPAAPPAPAAVAAPPVPAVDMAAIKASAVAEFKSELAKSMGLAPDASADPHAALRLAEEGQKRAAVQQLAINSGIPYADRFAASLKDHPAFAVNVSTGKFKDEAAAAAAVAAELAAAPFWKPAPAAPAPVANAGIVVAPDKSLPPTPAPPVPPTNSPAPAKWGWDSFKNIMTGPAPSAAKR